LPEVVCLQQSGPGVPFVVLLVMAMATPAVDRLRSSIRVLNVKNDDLLMDFDNIFLSAKLVAEEVEKHHDASSVQDLHDATLDIARCAHTLRTYKEALEALAASYQASSEVRFPSFPSSPLSAHRNPTLSHD
jgi:hypothetical protein